MHGPGHLEPGGIAADTATSASGTPGGRDGSRDELVTRFVSALARSIHAFHTYPPGSPARLDVIEVARDALRPCISDGVESVSIGVTNEGLRIGGEVMRGGGGPERAMLLTLRKAYVSTLEVRGDATTRDFRQFSELLAFPDQFLGRIEELPEILAERGVGGIVAHVIPTHHTIEGGTLPDVLLDLVRKRQAEVGAPEGEEAAEGGWIRLDPSVPLERVALEDLPLMLRDAPSLAMALQTMTAGTGPQVSPTEALIVHYEEITDLYSACDPAIADSLFRRLASVVQALPPRAKEKLLTDDVLPSLVDGRASGSILAHFSEEEVSSALLLLLDLGVGGVEMLTAGLANLDLPESRARGVIASVSSRMQQEDLAGAELLSTASLETHALEMESIDPEERLTVQADHTDDFSAFRSFDLSVDERAETQLLEIVGAIQGSEPIADALLACSDLLTLSADPTVTAAAIRRSRGLFFDLESRGDLASLAGWLACYARIVRLRTEQDAEVAASVEEALAEYVTPEFVHRVSALPADTEEESPLVTIICELGATGVGALVDSLAAESDRAARNRLLTALQPRAPDLAEYLVDYLSHPQWFVVRNVVALLGHAGPGHESIVARCIDHDHPRVVRETFFALARIGTPAAARCVCEVLGHESPEARRLAGEALWRFAPEVSHPLVLTAVSDRGLTASQPAQVRDLIAGAGRRHVSGLGPTLRRLRWHVLAIWNPERRRLGWTAQRVLRGLPR